MSSQAIEKANIRRPSQWISQFRHPTGWRGLVVGHILARKNTQRSKWVLSLLDLQPSHRVLEIGFGPGADIQRVAACVPRGFVTGIDHSATMVRQASARNARAIAAGLIDLRLGTASPLPFESDTFDTAFAINVAQFWDQPAEVAVEIRRVLKPGGRIALAVQPRSKGATGETVDKTAEIIRSALTEAGFDFVRLERKALRPVSAVCALGTK